VLDPEPVVVEPDTADPVVVLFVAVDVDVTTVPDVANWLAPSAVIIDTSSTVAPLIKISSVAELSWNKDPNSCPDWFGTITTVSKSGAS
tara:strand:- start:45 stop:311 length:267 start_codon:yes stop_codon:yes gene_type:complete